MQLPEALVSSLAGTKGFNKEAFQNIHASGEQVTSIRLNPAKQLSVGNLQSSIRNQQSAIPWTEHGYYLTERPSFTFDPSFHSGCYYVQEASSMFLEQALKQTAGLSQPLRVLDLCAAPGGKSTHIQSLITKDSLLVSNEVIRSRVNILKDNIIKWGCDNVVVTHNDPSDFSGLENYFDVIVIDAPCSGSGLFRRDPEAINEWSPDNVQLCSQRQQRIIADIWPCLKKDGVLIYSTCSYSAEEDEEIVDWIVANLPADYCSLSIDSAWGIVESSRGYRFWPDKVKGEGLFLSALRKTDGGDRGMTKLKHKVLPLTKQEIAFTEKWIEKGEYQFVKNQDIVFAWPRSFIEDMDLLMNSLRVIYSGIRIGELLHDKLIPDHALAMSEKVISTVPRNELDHTKAIQYLQRKDFSLNDSSKGWQLVTYGAHALGWVNVLSNRINNYYPKELRILKDV